MFLRVVERLLERVLQLCEGQGRRLRVSCDLGPRASEQVNRLVHVGDAGGEVCAALKDLHLLAEIVHGGGGMAVVHVAESRSSLMRRERRGHDVGTRQPHLQLPLPTSTPTRILHPPAPDAAYSSQLLAMMRRPARDAAVFCAFACCSRPCHHQLPLHELPHPLVIE